MSKSINWLTTGDALERLTRDSISEFARKHTSETFYGFAFECYPFSGQIILCLNTPESLELAVNGEIRPKAMMNEELRRMFPSILPAYERLFGLDGGKPAPRSQRADALRWGMPLWKYCDIANEAHNAGWQPYSDLLTEAARPKLDDFPDSNALIEYQESFKEALLRSVCSVAIRLESTKAFDYLNKTTDFQVCVIDGEEASEHDWKRMENVRSEF
ncbi:MAG: DUF4303 domain-containing protein [Planctomycetaceae bacterium]|nr:DUF4303 domain-containing protein [Planctomycetaceae bacterium]